MKIDDTDVAIRNYLPMSSLQMHILASTFLRHVFSAFALKNDVDLQNSLILNSALFAKWVLNKHLNRKICEKVSQCGDTTVLAARVANRARDWREASALASTSYIEWQRLPKLWIDLFVLYSTGKSTSVSVYPCAFRSPRLKAPCALLIAERLSGPLAKLKVFA